MTGRFLILGLQRSGTTYAAAAVRGHPQASMLGPELKQEFYGAGMQGFVSGEATFDEVQRAYPRIFDAMTSPNARDGVRSWGAKSAVATYTEAVLMCDCLDQFFPDVKVVLVTRDDAVASYGSLERAKSSGVWHSFAGGAQSGAIRLAPRRFRDYLELRELVTHRFRTLAHGRPFLELRYEQDVTSGEAPAKLFEFLGLDPVEPDWIRIAKLNPEARDYIKNHDKLLAVAASRSPLGEAEEARRAAAVRREHARGQTAAFLLGLATDHAVHERWARAAETLDAALAREDAPYRPYEMAGAYAALEAAEAADCPDAAALLARVESACGANAAFLQTRATRRERAGARELAVQDLTSALGGSAGLTANDVPACLASLERLLAELDDEELGARTIEALKAHCDGAQLAALRAALRAGG